jgi:hypothetical protein
LGISLIEANDDIGALLILTDGANNIGEDPIKYRKTGYSGLFTGCGHTISRKDIFISKINISRLAISIPRRRSKWNSGRPDWQAVRSIGNPRR